MDLIRISESDNFVVDYDKSKGTYRVSVFEDGHFKDEYWFDAYSDKECKRLIQHYADDEHMWQYVGDEPNPCGCGSNCYHYEYDRSENKIYGVCNGCHTDIYIVRDEYTNDKLKIGMWL